MAHNLNERDGRFSIAFAGDRGDIWHRHGQEARPDWTLDQWIAASNLNYQVLAAPAFAEINGQHVAVPDKFFNYHSETGHVFHCHSDRRQEVQPKQIVEFIHDFVSVDDRFKLSVMGALGAGETIWATANFNGDTTVGGDKHQMHLLASTRFDGSGATVLQMTGTRVVCNNTIRLAWGDTRAQIKVRHNTKFDKARAAKQLAAVAQTVDTYKAIGDALAENNMAREETIAFFKTLLEIPFDAKKEDLSTRKLNIYEDLWRARERSIAEGAAPDSAWSNLQAVTRYVDHERTARKTGSWDTDESARFESAQFGSGDVMKGKAMALLMPRIKERVPVLA